MDNRTKEQRRRNMQAVKNKGSKIETTLGKALWAKGYRYRKNDGTVFGTPDFVFKKLKIAIFVDSEFWHGKDWARAKLQHKSNEQFWIAKIEGNIRRDRLVNRTLKRDGWTVVRFWGKRIEKNMDDCLAAIEKAFSKTLSSVE